MIFINWYRIDWFFWDWIFIGLLILSVLILRLFRRIFRWKNVEIHGIQTESKSLEMVPKLVIVYKKECDQTESNQYKSTIMVFSSLFGSKRTIHSFAKSLCLAHGKVFLVDFSMLVKQINKHSLNVLLQSIVRLIHEESIQNFIFMDISSLLFWKFHQLNQKLMEQAKILFIRPIFTLKELISPLSTEALFAGGPFLLFRLRLLFYSSQLKSLFEEPPITDMFNLDLPNPYRFLVLPKKSMDRSVEKFISNDINNKSQIIHFSNGGWSFYKQETMIMGILNGFFNERFSN